MKKTKYERLLNGENKPSERNILATIGTRGTKLWQQLRAFLKVNYDFKPEMHFYGRKYGWCFKYTRKNKTLCVLFPETKAFSVLVVLGKNEVAQFEENRLNFNEDTQRLFKTAHQYHDGKWLYKRVLNKSDVKDVIGLVRMKRRQKGRESS